MGVMSSAQALDFETPDDTFRMQLRQWLNVNLVGEFASLRGRGGPGDEDIGFDIRVEWERVLGAAGLIGIGWPLEHGGRAATLDKQVIFAQEYARAEAPARVNHMGEHLLGPTLIEYGTPEQCARFLPGILDGTVRWCQGFSEPNAGSDLANVATKARVAARADGRDEWIINGQKVWTSLAHVSHWCFVVARTEEGSTRHRGLSFLLVPMDQPQIEVRPIAQMSGGGEFCETFFTEARTDADLVVGRPGEGWRVSIGLLAMERGVSTLAQQVGFEREFERLLALARNKGLLHDAVWRNRLMQSYTGLQLMRWNGLRSMSGHGVPGPEASISKLFWGTWHQQLGEMFADAGGMAFLADDVETQDFDLERKLFLFTRSDTIYGGSHQVQRNILGERVLGLPKEPS